MTFLDLAKKRYSCRSFTLRPVEEEKLERVLAAANAAPTAKNAQPHRLYLLQSSQALAAVDSLCNCRYGAPLVLLFTYDRGEDWKSPHEEGVHSGEQDVSIVATHVMLQAAELDLDSCWCVNFPTAAMERALDLPEGERAVLLMPLGYGDEKGGPGPRHSQRKPLEETIRRL